MRRRARLLILSMAATFAITRVALHLSPDTDLNIGGYNIHHLFTGVLLMGGCGITAVLGLGDNRAAEMSVAGFGVGLSLALDEWVYLIATDGSNASYLLPVSYIGGALMVGLACLCVLLISRGDRRKASNSLRRRA